MKTVDDVMVACEPIKKLWALDGATYGGVYRTLREQDDDLTPEQYFTLWLVASETSLPETALLVKKHLSIRYIRLLPIERQVDLIRNGGTLDLLMKGPSGYYAEQRTYKQLNKKECRQLFTDDVIYKATAFIDCLKYPEKDYFVRLEPA